MTRVIPQIVNTKTTLRAAVQALPDTVKVQALLGLDGDCDFSLRTSESLSLPLYEGGSPVPDRPAGTGSDPAYGSQQ